MTTNKDGNGLLQNLQDARKDGAHFMLSLSEISDVIDAMTRAQPQNVNGELGHICSECYGSGNKKGTDSYDVAWNDEYKCNICQGVGGVGLVGKILWYLRYKSLGHAEVDAVEIANIIPVMKISMTELSHPNPEPSGDVQAALDALDSIVFISRDKIVPRDNYMDVTEEYNAIRAALTAQQPDVPEWLKTLDYQRDLALILMVAKGSKDYDDTIGDRIQRVQQLILEQKQAIDRAKAEGKVS